MIINYQHFVPKGTKNNLAKYGLERIFRKVLFRQPLPAPGGDAEIAFSCLQQAEGIEAKHPVPWPVALPPGMGRRPKKIRFHC
jgi:hypothetical protein